MKILIILFLFMTSASFASYECSGPQGTTLKYFVIHTLNANEIATSLDGGMDRVEAIENNVLQYFYHNGCDNEIYFRLHNAVTKYHPQMFTMNVDYITEEEVLTGVEVLCRKK